MKTIILAALLAFAGGALAQVPSNMQRNPPNGGAVVRPLSSVVYNYVLTANTNKAVTPPSNANWVIISADCGTVWVKRNGVAVIPVGDVTDGTGVVYNPNSLGMEGISLLGFIAPAACKLSLEFFRG